jgi:mannose-1-phosphate guanylyltransferase
MREDSSAIVLMGGRGERLAQILQGRAKALTPFCGYPFLELLLRKLHRDGFGDVVLVSDRPRRELDELLAGRRDLGRPTVVYSQEGTAPAVLAGLEAVTNTDIALCVNGDTILDAGYWSALEQHAHSSRPLTLLTSTRDDVPNRGAVHLEANGSVAAFAEGPRGAELADHGRAVASRESNCGAYVLDVSAVLTEMRAVPETSFEHETLPRLAQSGMVNGASVGSQLFLDFGTPERLDRASSLGDVMREIYEL